MYKTTSSIQKLKLTNKFAMNISDETDIFKFNMELSSDSDIEMIPPKKFERFRSNIIYT